MPQQCRMTTAAKERCTRMAEGGGLGLCWQHVPVREQSDRLKWKDKIALGSLAISSSELLLKVAELAYHHLHELLNGGDLIEERDSKKDEVGRLLNIRSGRMVLPSKNYDPGSRVDWQGLSYLVREAKLSRNMPPTFAITLDSAFDHWFTTLPANFQADLLNAIADYVAGSKLS